MDFLFSAPPLVVLGFEMDFQQVDSGSFFSGILDSNASIPDPTSINFLDSGIRISLHVAINGSLGSRHVRERIWKFDHTADKEA